VKGLTAESLPTIPVDVTVNVLVDVESEQLKKREIAALSRLLCKAW
jgi:hypothetical protein